MIRLYEKPTPSNEVIQDSIGALTLAVDNSLRKGASRDFNISVEFRHDVYRFLFKDKTILFCSDFNTRYFKVGWDQCFCNYSVGTEHNYGCKLLYPIQARLSLKWMKPGHYRNQDGAMFAKSLNFIEILKLKIKKINC